MSTREEKKLMDQVHEVVRVNHYSIHTERTYCDWIKRFIVFHKMKNKSGYRHKAGQSEPFDQSIPGRQPQK